MKRLFSILLAVFTFSAHAGNNTYIQGPTLIESLSSFVTSAGVTDLYRSSNTNIHYTGSSTQQVNLPDATGLKVGRRFNIYNTSTGNVVVKDFSGTTLSTLIQDTAVSFVLADGSSSAGLWALFETTAALLYQIDGANSSVIEGDIVTNTANGLYSHAEGTGAAANGNYSHVEGHNNSAVLNGHAEGDTTVVSATSGHAQGTATTASGTSSHAAGNSSTASGLNSFVHALGGIAQAFNQFVIGQYNIAQGTGGSYVAGDDAFIIGRGANGSARANAFSITKEGKLKIYGSLSGIVTLGAADTTTPYSLFFPATQGAANTVPQNDGSGNLTWVPNGSGSGDGVFNIIRDNSGAETGSTANWTASGGTFTTTNTAADVGFGSYAFSFDASGAQNVRSDAYAIPAGLYGHNCSARVLYKGGDALLTANVLDGSNVLVAGPVTLSPNTTYAYSDPITFPCPSSGSLKFEITASANAAIIYFDSVQIAENQLINISQAELVGTMSITGCNTLFGWSSGSYADSTLSSCTYTATGRLVAPSTVVPGWSTSNGLEAGEYFVTVSDEFNLGSGQETAVTITDGTISSRDLTQYLTQGSGGGGPGLLSFNFSVPNTQATPTDFRIQAKVLAGGGSFAANATAGDFMVFSVYKFPTAQQKAISPGASPVIWSGTVTGTTALTSASEADFPGTGVVTPGDSRNAGTVAAAAVSNGVTFTPASAAIWEICMSGDLSLNTSNASGAVRLTDGSDVALTPEQNFTQATAGGNVTVGRCATKYLNSFAPYTVKIRGKVNSGTISLGTDIQWTIKKMEQPLGAPHLVNSVVTPSAGVENIVSVTFGGASEPSACTSSPCTIYRQNGGVSSVTRNATGSYTINMNASSFSSTPRCTCSSRFAGAFVVCGMPFDSPSIDPVLESVGLISGLDTDEEFTVNCVGPK